MTIKKTSMQQKDEPTVRQPILEMVGALDERALICHNLLSVVHERLSPIMRMDDGKSEPQPQVASSCELRTDLAQLQCTLDQLQVRLEHLLNHIDL
jgi:hypothetical protein